MVKALLVWAYCLSCNSGVLSITKFDSLEECEWARTALIREVEEGGGWGMRKSFERVHMPQCIEYQIP